MPRFPVYLALVVFATQAWAQTGRQQSISAEDAQQFEDSLKRNPNDGEARGALLTYYFGAQKLDRAAVIEARRRHILWFIENAPGDDLAGSPAASIDASGQPLADPEGYQLASAAWHTRVARKETSARELANAASFFKLSDREFSIDLLERALKLEPANPQIAGFLGVSYAMAILGVTALNDSGYPMSTDQRLAESPLAKKARQTLETSQNVYALVRAGYTLSYQGSILREMGKLSFDAAPLAEQTLVRALNLDPGNDGIAEMLSQHRQMHKTTPTK